MLKLEVFKQQRATSKAGQKPVNNSAAFRDERQSATRPSARTQEYGCNIEAYKTEHQSMSNEVRQFEGFYVSFNPDPEWGGGGPETALCVGESYPSNLNHYLILSGDWREEYAQIAPQGLKACMKFYFEHRDLSNEWSHDAKSIEEFESSKVRW